MARLLPRVQVLRLNSAAIAHISSGHVVNLVSNDVRRFDDALPFWIFLWAGENDYILCQIYNFKFQCGV